MPARRALSWQLLQPDGAPVVRERYWLSFQAGELRSCTSCHGVNTTDQAGHSAPANQPAALRTLLESLKLTEPSLAAADTFRIWAEATHGIALQPDADDDADGSPNIVEWAQGSSPLARPAQPSPPLKAMLPTRVLVGSKLPIGRASGRIDERLAKVRLRSGRFCTSVGRHNAAEL